MVEGMFVFLTMYMFILYYTKSAMTHHTHITITHTTTDTNIAVSSQGTAMSLRPRQARRALTDISNKAMKSATTAYDAVINKFVGPTKVVASAATSTNIAVGRKV